jgi:GT2 family glycosyltransferase
LPGEAAVDKIEDRLTIGFTIPIVMMEFLEGCLRSIQQASPPKDLRVCVVNDGNMAIQKELEQLCGQFSWVDLLILKENRMFAGANNAGWRYLLEKYPDINYLGSLNSDTLVRPGWLEGMITVFDQWPAAGMVAPVMETQEKWLRFFKRKKTLATWRLGDWETPMILDRANITSDTECQVLGGFCFLIRRQALLNVGMFSEEYMNSCEDVDLSLKLRKAGYQLVVSSRSRVFHYAASFRYMPGARTNLNLSHQILREKWHL